MKPFLETIANGGEFNTKDINMILSREFNLTKEELEESLPSGKQGVFVNRVAWAKAHLKIAGLLESTGRGTFKITDNGKNVLAKNIQRIDLKFLKTLPDYIEYSAGKQSAEGESVVSENEDFQTPNEVIETEFLKIQDALSKELISKIKSCNPFFFENLVVELLVKMGYGGSLSDAGKAIGKSGDEGIDGIIKEDKLGLDVIYIQAKRWEGNVGRPEIQKFVGALAGQGAKKGIFITTSKFTPDALHYIPRNETKIVLIDGAKLTQLMIEHNLGVSVHNTYELEKNRS